VAAATVACLAAGELAGGSLAGRRAGVLGLAFKPGPTTSGTHPRWMWPWRCAAKGPRPSSVTTTVRPVSGARMVTGSGRAVRTGRWRAAFEAGRRGK
jgi:hypothetical protein